MSDKIDYTKIFETESKIDTLLDHNIKRYKYVGEKGKEYHVIQSIFADLNKLNELSNKQIRWYSVIIHIAMSFRNQREQGHMFDPSIIETPYGFKAGAEARDIEGEFYFAIPPYIGLIESVIIEIARLGVFISAWKDIDPGYLDHKSAKLDLLLTKLVEAVIARAGMELEEEVFLLAIKRAADNILILGKYFPEHTGENYLKAVNSKHYKTHIIDRIDKIPPDRLETYYNIDAFWDGFITDYFTPLIRG